MGSFNQKGYDANGSPEVEEVAGAATATIPEGTTEGNQPKRRQKKKLAQQATSPVVMQTDQPEPFSSVDPNESKAMADTEKELVPAIEENVPKDARPSNPSNVSEMINGGYQVGSHSSIGSQIQQKAEPGTGVKPEKPKALVFANQKLKEGTTPESTSADSLTKGGTTKASDPTAPKVASQEAESPLQKREREWDEYIDSLSDPEEKQRLQALRAWDKPLYQRLAEMDKYRETPDQRAAREKKEDRTRKLIAATQLIGALAKFGIVAGSKDGRDVPMVDMLPAYDKAIKERDARRQSRYKELDNLEVKLRESRKSQLNWLDSFRKQRQSNALAEARIDVQKAREERNAAKTQHDIEVADAKLKQAEQKLENEKVRLGIQQQNANTSSYRASIAAENSAYRREGKNTEIRFGENGKHSVLLDDHEWAKNPGNITYVFNSLPKSVREKVGDEIRDKYTDEVKGHKRPTIAQMRAAIRQHINDYSDVGRAVLEVAGEDYKDSQYDEYFGRKSGHKGDPYGRNEQPASTPNKNHKKNPYE